MTNDALTQYLNSLSRQDRYRVDTSLKASEFEHTDVVFLCTEDGTESGPFIRKTIKRDTGLGQAYERIFEQQQAGFTSNSIPFIHECYADETKLTVVMDYIAGETLQDLIYRLDPSPELTAYLFPQICDAVNELHTAFNPPLIHRDLKPSNIMVHNNQVFIIDFGIARDLKDQASSDTMHFGTRAYAPPEQFGYGQTTTRSDVYALGMLLYFCLVEETPSSAVVEARFKDARISPALQDVLVKASAFDPNNRYASALELKAAFLNAMQNHVSGASAVNQQPNYAPAAQANYAPPAQPNYAPPTQASYAPPVQPGYTQNTQPVPLQPPQAPQETREQHPARTIVGVVWNTLVALAALVVIGASVSCIFNVPENMAQYPAIVNNTGYGLVIPAIVLYIVLLLLDKSRLKKRFPHSFGKLNWRSLLFIGAFVLIVTFAFLTLAAIGVSLPSTAG